MAAGEKFWHFDDASLPGEWSALSGNGGSVAMSDHGVLLTGANTGYAAIVKAFDRTLGKYQRITACVRTSNQNFRPGMGLMYEVGGLTGGTLAVQSPKFLCRAYTYSSAGSWYGQLSYWDTGGAGHHWIDSSKAWGTTSAASTPLISVDDYYIVGLDWDDEHDRVRLFWVHVASGSTFASEPHGPKLFALTDWVDLSSLQHGGQTSNLWLYLGWILAQTDTTGLTQHVEWVRHEWADARIPSFCNIKAYDSGTGYRLRAYSSLRADGVKLPVSRTGYALDVVPATFESVNVGQWGSVTYDPVTATYWMTYAAGDGADMTIGLASASDPFGSWTKYGGNPILPRDSGTEYDQKVQSCLVLDYTEPDPAQRWKLVVSVLSALDGHLRVYLYTASQPDTTAWTRQGVLIDWDAGNLDGDMGPELYAPPLYLHGRWYLHYVGLSTTPPFLNYVAVGDRLAAGAFTVDRAVNFLDAGNGVELTITSASSTSRLVGVGSTTGVQRDDVVMYDEDASDNNWRLGRVRKVVSATQLELYHLMPGIGTSGVLRTLTKGKQYAHHLMPYGDEWLWHSTLFGTLFGHASFSSGYEGAGLFRSPDPPPHGPPTPDRLNTPGWWLGRDGDTGSTENPRFVSAPVHPYTQALTVRRRRRSVHLRR